MTTVRGALVVGGAVLVGLRLPAPARVADGVAQAVVAALESRRPW